MFRISFYLLSLLSAVLLVQSKSELFVLRAPSGLQFQNNHELRVSKLDDILETIMGYTVENGYDWRGFEIMNPFTAFANCLLIFRISGIRDLNFPSITFHPLQKDDNLEDIFSRVSQDIDMRHPENENFMLKVDVGDVVEVEGSPNLAFFGADKNETSSALVDDLSRMKNIINRIVKKRNKYGSPDIYWLNWKSVAPKIELESDAKELLTLTLNAIAEKVQNIYNGKAFVAVITDDEDQYLTRSKRQASAKATISLDDLNLADDYDEDFPVIFNIILWLSLALLFSLIAISMVIAGMDPGRDSIIYRMTSTRMKKDN